MLWPTGSEPCRDGADGQLVSATAESGVIHLVGAPSRIRTCDTRFRKPLLYPLSYGG